MQDVFVDYKAWEWDCNSCSRGSCWISISIHKKWWPSSITLYCGVEQRMRGISKLVVIHVFGLPTKTTELGNCLTQIESTYPTPSSSLFTGCLNFPHFSLHPSNPSQKIFRVSFTNFILHLNKFSKRFASRLFLGVALSMCWSVCWYRVRVSFPTMAYVQTRKYS